MCQALDLDRRNVDAWVARGAAYANQHAFPKAVSDFQTALGVSNIIRQLSILYRVPAFVCFAAALQHEHIVLQFHCKYWLYDLCCNPVQHVMRGCLMITFSHYTQIHLSSVSPALYWTNCAEIEPGHVNASKYLRVTEQHMTQLGLPIAISLQQPVPVDNTQAPKGHHQAAEQAAPVHLAAAQIHLTTTGMSPSFAARTSLQPISICVIVCVFA